LYFTNLLYFDGVKDLNVKAQWSKRKIEHWSPFMKVAMQLSPSLHQVTILLN